jgi:hypothetical protein
MKHEVKEFNFAGESSSQGKGSQTFPTPNLMWSIFIQKINIHKALKFKEQRSS